MDMSAQRPKKIKTFSFKKLLKNGMLLFLCAYVVYTFASQQITLSRCSRVAKDYEDKIAEEKLTEAEAAESLTAEQTARISEQRAEWEKTKKMALIQ